MPLYVPRRNVALPNPAVGQYATTASARLTQVDA